MRNLYFWLTTCLIPRSRKSKISLSARINLWRVHWTENCQLAVGDGSIISSKIYFERPEASVCIGHSTFVGASKIIAAEKVEIGNNVLVSWDVTIVDHDSHSLDWIERKEDVRNWYLGKKIWNHVAIRPVKICDKAWIGFGATILKGVTVGEGAVVGAGSVVRSDVEPYTVVVGNPASVVRRLAPINEKTT
jgi:acetyltransferase-like isoleucine patch superfamily enzyme